MRIIIAIMTVSVLGICSWIFAHPFDTIPWDGTYWTISVTHNGKPEVFAHCPHGVIGKNWVKYENTKGHMMLVTNCSAICFSKDSPPAP